MVSGRADGIRLEGEGEIAQDFRDFLSTLDIDWEELLSRAVGDVPARLMMRTVEGMPAGAPNFGTRPRSNSGDYLLVDRVACRTLLIWIVSCAR